MGTEVVVGAVEALVAHAKDGAVAAVASDARMSDAVGLREKNALFKRHQDVARVKEVDLRVASAADVPVWTVQTAPTHADDAFVAEVAGGAVSDGRGECRCGRGWRRGRGAGQEVGAKGVEHLSSEVFEPASIALGLGWKCCRSRSSSTLAVADDSGWLGDALLDVLDCCEHLLEEVLVGVVCSVFWLRLFSLGMRVC